MCNKDWINAFADVLCPSDCLNKTTMTISVVLMKY